MSGWCAVNASPSLIASWLRAAGQLRVKAQFPTALKMTRGPRPAPARMIRLRQHIPMKREFAVQPHMMYRRVEGPAKNRGSPLNRNGRVRRRFGRAHHRPILVTFQGGSVATGKMVLPLPELHGAEAALLRAGVVLLRAGVVLRARVGVADSGCTAHTIRRLSLSTILPILLLLVTGIYFPRGICMHVYGLHMRKLTTGWLAGCWLPLDLRGCPAAPVDLPVDPGRLRS